MKKKKIIGMILALAVGSSTLAACGGGDAESGKATASGDEIPTLKWVTVGTGMPKNYETWLGQVNPYLEEKIGVNIEMEVVPWGDWDNRRSIVTNSGEYFDLFFTDKTRYNMEVASGVFMDLTNMLNETPKLYDMLPEDYWRAVSVDGKIYGVPTYKDCSLTEYFIWDKDIADKYGIDINKTNDFEALYNELGKVRDGEGSAPLHFSDSGANALLDMYYDNAGVGSFVGVNYDDETRTVVNPLENEIVLSQLDTVYKMYSEGIINGDAPTADDAPKYRMLFLGQGWSGAAKTSWGPNSGIANCEAVQFGETVMSNKTVQGSINSIFSGSENPAKALEFLQLINTDTKLRDLFYYGVEGEDFNYVEDNKVEKVNSDWSMAGYTQGTFFNVSQLSSVDFNQWDEVKELNQNAKPSPLLGFTVDLSSMETEVASCTAVYEKYRKEFFTGAQNPRELIKTINAELEAAGWEKVREETQRQIDAFNFES
ncbi:MAG: ABC transporter substrate-binding protein [Lachnospirales bacterium]